MTTRPRRRGLKLPTHLLLLPALVVNAVADKLVFDPVAVGCTNDIQDLYQDGDILKDAETDFLDYFVEQCVQDQMERSYDGRVCAFPLPSTDPSAETVATIANVYVDFRGLSDTPEYNALVSTCAGNHSLCSINTTFTSQGLQEEYVALPICTPTSCQSSGLPFGAFVDQTCQTLWNKTAEQCDQLQDNAIAVCQNVTNTRNETAWVDTCTTPNTPLEYAMAWQTLSNRVQRECLAPNAILPSYCKVERTLPDFRFDMDFSFRDSDNTSQELLQTFAQECESHEGTLCQGDVYMEYDILKFPAPLTGKMDMRGYPMCFPSSDDCLDDTTKQSIMLEAAVWEFLDQVVSLTRRRRMARLDFQDLEWRSAGEIVASISSLNEGKVNNSILNYYGEGLCSTDNTFNCTGFVSNFVCGGERSPVVLIGDAPDLVNGPTEVSGPIESKNKTTSRADEQKPKPSISSAELSANLLPGSVLLTMLTFTTLLM